MKNPFSYFKKDTKKTKVLNSLFTNKKIILIEQIESDGVVKIEVKEPIVRHNLI